MEYANASLTLHKRACKLPRKARQRQEHVLAAERHRNGTTGCRRCAREQCNGLHPLGHDAAPRQEGDKVITCQVQPNKRRSEPVWHSSRARKAIGLPPSNVSDEGRARRAIARAVRACFETEPDCTGDNNRRHHEDIELATDLREPVQWWRQSKGPPRSSNGRFQACGRRKHRSCRVGWRL